MCTIVKRILKQKSKAASKKDTRYDYCITHCPHGIEQRFLSRKGGGSYYVLVGKDHYRRADAAKWPAEVQEFFRTGLTARSSPRPTKAPAAQKLAKASALLAKWQRKQKLADTKVKQYSKQVKHLQKKLPQAEFEHLLRQVPELEI